ncbi:MAG: hypothetical protein IPJ17_00455 [Holophagales bacterium]|nr:MAG: hypothetical protein IPJ17_00455 [Holophagales bacterium]
MTLDAQIERVADHLQAAGAVAVVGAGFSWPAGIPLAYHLAPLLWQALDENASARAALALRLGRVDSPGQVLIGHDAARLRQAYDVVRQNDGVRWSFQAAFAARDASINHQSTAHDALARLFHRGTAEIVISFNWDTLLERCFARRYGGRLAVGERFWKPHGDAARSDEHWVLPGDSGHLPDAIVERVNELVRERPRLLLIVGYSESDEWVADQLTKPLADRWLVSRIGPDASGDLALRGSADEVLTRLAARLVPEPELLGWRFAGLAESRGLGPALLGLPLGIADAGACPKLPEVDQVLSRLHAGHSAAVVGPPGSGKSLCAAQSLLELSALGYSIIRPIELLRDGCEIPLAGQRFPHVVFIDDAHLESRSLLRRLREVANERLLLLVAATESEGVEVDRGAIRIDTRRAVASIAGGLRTDLRRTLAAVRALDDRVGEGYLDETIEARISEAERSEQPWQFCFVLGGGWRRASEAVDAARVAGADLVLVAAAVHQLVTLDSQGRPDAVGALAAAAGVSSESFVSAIQWLVRERLLLSADDLRCPHQRLAMVVLGAVYQGLTADRRALFFEICRAAVGDRRMPLLGVHSLLDTLRFADAIRWNLNSLLGSRVESDLLARCFESKDAEVRMAAALLLTDLEAFTDDWLEATLRPRIPDLTRWIAEAEHPSGFGLSRLMNNVYNRDRAFAEEICDRVDARALAEVVSCAGSSAAWSMAELIDRLRLGTSASWRALFVSALDRAKLLSAGEEWSEEHLAEFARLAAGVGAYDEDLGLSMMERAEPRFRRWFSATPLEAFRNLDDLLFHFLRVWDPLGIYVGSLRPSSRARALARRLLEDIDPSALAASISAGSRASLEDYAKLLGYFARTKPRLHRAVVTAIDLDRLAAAFEGHWKRLPHELEILAGQLRAGPDHEPVVSWLRRHSDRIEVLAVRLAIMSPSLAADVVKRGGSVALDQSMTFEWFGVAYIIDSLARERPDLVEALVGPHVDKAAEALARNQANTYDHVDAFVSVLAEHAPGALARILDRVNPGAAEVAWAACLEGSPGARRSAAKLIAAALVHGGEIAEVAGRLRSRYPKASVPASKLSFEISGLRQSRRKAKARRPLR